MGTPAFAVPALQQIATSDHQLVAVVTGLDKRAGRGRKPTPTPVKSAAAELGYPIIQPPDLRDAVFHTHLRGLAADLFVVVAFRILPDAVLAIPPRGAINLHPSLLPAYRGAAPIRHALLNGDEQTGITIIALTRDIDAGDMLLQRSAPIRPADDHGSLSARLALEGATLLLETIDGLANGSIIPRPQDPSAPSLPAPKIVPADQQIDWRRPAAEIVNRIRAFSPTPGAVTTLAGKGLKLFAAAAGDGQGTPGAVLAAGDWLEVAAGTGSVRITELQIEGRRRLQAAVYFRGAPLELGRFLGQS